MSGSSSQRPLQRPSISLEYSKVLKRRTKETKNNYSNNDDDTMEIDLIIASSATNTITALPVVTENDNDGGICIDLTNFSGRIRIHEHNIPLLSNQSTIKPNKSSTRNTETDVANRRQRETSSDDTRKSVPPAPNHRSTSFSDTFYDALTNSQGQTQTSLPLQDNNAEVIWDLNADLENANHVSFLENASNVDGEEDDEDNDDDDDDDEDEYLQNSTGFLFDDTFASTSHGSGYIPEPTGQTPLHELVDSPGVTVALVQELVRSSPEMVKEADSNGRLPLHVLGNNSQLLSSLDGQCIAKQCAMILIDAYPLSVVIPDKENHMPFIKLIHKWVMWVHLREMKVSTKRQSTSFINPVNDAMRLIQNVLLETPSVQKSDLPYGMRSSVGSLHESSNNLRSSNRQLPPVIIFEQVEWSFEMLSIIMNYLGGNTFDPTQRGSPMLSYKKQRHSRQLLAQNLASIPQIFKTIMSLELNEVRQNIINSSITRRAMLCKECIGPWLTSMIRSKRGTSAEMAINFIEAVSRLNVDDYVGGYREPLPRDEEFFREAKSSVYEVAEGLLELIPSLLVLKHGLIDRAVSMPLIWFIMNRRITTPFTVGVTVTDFQLHLTLIIAVRDVSFETYQSDFSFLAAKIVVLLLALYQVARKVMELLVLSRISLEIAKRFALNFWNLIELCSIVGALLTATLSQDFTHPMWSAILLGLLWFRLLGFLKVVNEPLATFIVALKKIFFDIRFFSVVFFILILTFGDMFHLVFVGDPNVQCNDPTNESSIDENFCSPDIISSYLRVYAIIIGDFEFSDYQQTASITFLWATVTFLGTVVLLNVLIAVVTTSYERAQKSSLILFRKSRGEFFVSNVAVERFLTNQDSEEPRILHRLSRRSSRLAMVILFLVTVVFSCLYLIERIIRISNKRNPVVLACLGFMCIVMLYSLWSTLTFVVVMMLDRFTANTQNYLKSKVFPVIEYVNDRLIVKGLASAMFGIDVKDTEGGEVIDIHDVSNEELVGRMDKMENLIGRTLEKVEATIPTSTIPEETNNATSYSSLPGI